MKAKRKVLVLGPGRVTRGGITAVIEAYGTHPMWKSWNCRWLETHSDRSAWQKLFYFLKAFFGYPFILPGYDILHIHFSEPMSAIRKLLFMVPAKLLGKKIVLHFHSFSAGTTIESRFRPLYTWMFRNADAVIVLSEYWHRQVARIPEHAPIQVIHNPARIASSSDRCRYQIILFAGTLVSRKGYQELIRAFGMIADRHPAWTLVLAGNGETAEAGALCGELGITDRVNLPGWVAGREKEDLFHSASIFCLPSYAEGFPMSVIDAMAHRIPVLTTPVGGITDVFREHEHLMLVPPGNIYELAAKLDMMIRFPVMRQKMADASFTMISTMFSLDKVCGQVEDLYRSLSDHGHNQ